MYWFKSIAAGLLYFMLGALWYAPFAFGPKFNEALGYAVGVIPPNTPAMLIGPLLGCVAASLGIALLINRAKTTTRRDVAVLTLITSALFSVSAVGIDAVAPNQAASWTLLIIVGGYHVVGQLIVGQLIGPLSLEQRGGRGLG
ncbi:MAG: DUF1761 domain-containing protein [Archangium sp.]